MARSPFWLSGLGTAHRPMCPQTELCPLCTNGRSCLRFSHRHARGCVHVPHVHTCMNGRATTQCIPTALCPHSHSPPVRAHTRRGPVFRLACTHTREGSHGHSHVLVWARAPTTRAGSLSDSCQAARCWASAKSLQQTRENYGSDGCISPQKREVSLFSFPFFGASLLKCHE